MQSLEAAAESPRSCCGGVRSFEEVAAYWEGAYWDSDEQIDSIEFVDPFFKNTRVVGFRPRSSSTSPYQLPVPMLISKYNEGAMEVVYRAEYPY